MVQMTTVFCLLLSYYYQRLCRQALLGHVYYVMASFGNLLLLCVPMSIEHILMCTITRFLIKAVAPLVNQSRSLSIACKLLDGQDSCNCC